MQCLVCIFKVFVVQYDSMWSVCVNLVGLTKLHGGTMMLKQYRDLKTMSKICFKLIINKVFDTRVVLELTVN